MDQHWIFDLAERDPEQLLAMSEEEFRDAISDAGYDADELVAQFNRTVTEILSGKSDR